MRAEKKIRRSHFVLSGISLGLLFLIMAACAGSAKKSKERNADRKASAVSDTTANQIFFFGGFGVRESEYNLPFNAVIRKPTRDQVQTILDQAKAGHKKIILILTNIPHNEDKTFALQEWKTELDKFKDFDFTPYITDGTLIGNYLMDQPHAKNDWGGKTVPYSDLVEMAKYSKQIFPNMKTIIRTTPLWLKDGGQNPYLDIAWAQYSVRFGDPNDWIQKQITAAQQLHIKLISGLNILDGGGTTARRGTKEGLYSMTAAEMKYAGKLLMPVSETLIGFFMWKYDADFFNNTEITNAVKELSDFAKSRN